MCVVKIENYPGFLTARSAEVAALYVSSCIALLKTPDKVISSEGSAEAEKSIKKQISPLCSLFSILPRERLPNWTLFYKKTAVPSPTRTRFHSQPFANKEVTSTMVN
jgi:hypothetical protein